jgi:hypothetical protein
MNRLKILDYFFHTWSVGQAIIILFYLKQIYLLCMMWSVDHLDFLEAYVGNSDINIWDCFKFFIMA